MMMFITERVMVMFMVYYTLLPPRYLWSSDLWYYG